MDPSLRTRPIPSTLRSVASVGVLVAVYFVTARFGLLMDAVSGFATTVWPPTGIALAALILFGRRLWPGIALGALLVNLAAGAPFLTACGMAAGNTLEAVVGALLLRRFARFRGSFDHIQGVIGFVVLVAGLSTTISATLGVLSGWLGGVIPAATAGRAWLTWWLGDAMGDLLVAPLLLVWAERPRYALTLRRLWEAVSSLTSLVLVSLFVFGSLFTSDYAILLVPYLLLPFLGWAAFRFREHGAVTATFVVATIAIGMTAAGSGPFAGGSMNENLLHLQAFMGIVAVSMLVFAAGVAERRRAESRVLVTSSVARVLAGASTLEGGLPGVLSAIAESLEWDCGNVWMVDAGSGTLRHAAAWHRPESRLGAFGRTAEGLSFRPGFGMAGRVWSTGSPLWIPILAAEANFARAASAAKMGLRTAMGFPIFLGGEVHGVMTFFSRRFREPDTTLLQMLATLGGQIGEFIQRQKAETELRLAHAELESKVARRTEQLSEANRALHEEIAERRQAEESLGRLSARLLRVQDEERQRLARELHDSAAQSLAALSMNLAVARGCRGTLDERTRHALEESEALADRCLREIRSLSYLLHPPLLEEVGLSAALRWCATGFARRSGIAVEVELPSDFGRLPMDVENALFRIVQECLTNVHRHSGSPTAQIQLARRPGGVALEVRDQGRGMPSGIMARRDGVDSLGVGLLGMRERVRQLGGQLRIESSGQGSTVQVEINIASEGP